MLLFATEFDLLVWCLLRGEEKKGGRVINE